MTWLVRRLYALSALLRRVYEMLKAIFFYRFLFAKFGHRSRIFRPILISHPEHIEIGDRVTIRDGARLEVWEDGVNLNPLLRIGSETNIEQNVHIACHCRIQIGARVSITANCAIMDVFHPYEAHDDARKIGVRISTEPSFVEIGDDCFIGIGAIIMPNVRIGRNSVVGSNAVVTRDVPPNTIVAGVPARIIKQYGGP